MQIKSNSQRLKVRRMWGLVRMTSHKIRDQVGWTRRDSSRRKVGRAINGERLQISLVALRRLIECKMTRPNDWHSNNLATWTSKRMRNRVCRITFFKAISNLLRVVSHFKSNRRLPKPFWKSTPRVCLHFSKFLRTTPSRVTRESWANSWTKNTKLYAPRIKNWLVYLTKVRRMWSRSEKMKRRRKK